MYEILAKDLERTGTQTLSVMKERHLAKSTPLIALTAEAKKEDRPAVLVISSSKESLQEMKETLNDRYKGVYVRDEESAAKYLSKHSVKFVIRECDAYSEQQT